MIACIEGGGFVISRSQKSRTEVLPFWFKKAVTVSNLHRNTRRVVYSDLTMTTVGYGDASASYESLCEKTPKKLYFQSTRFAK